MCIVTSRISFYYTWRVTARAAFSGVRVDPIVSGA